MEVIAISPQYTLAKLVGGVLEDKIDVFEDQMQGLLFDQANELKQLPHAGFALLAITLSYFEPIGQFLEGRASGSKRQFILGLRDVFPNLDPATPEYVLSELYSQLRCGMFHRGITKSKVRVTRDGENPIEVVYTGHGAQVHQIVLAPRLLLEESERHLKRYVSKLRDPANRSLRENFLAWFDSRAA
jgi:hypothetical protein